MGKNEDMVRVGLVVGSLESWRTFVGSLVVVVYICMWCLWEIDLMRRGSCRLEMCLYTRDMWFWKVRERSRESHDNRQRMCLGLARAFSMFRLRIR